MKKDSDISVVRGTKNIFADPGFPSEEIAVHETQLADIDKASGGALWRRAPS